MNWWNLSVFCIIPIVSVIFFFFWKRKYLWIAPLTSTVISVAISLFAMPSILSDAEHRSMFFGISVMLHILIAVVLTVIAYVAVSYTHLVKTAMREVKIALLEADVNFKIVKNFIKTDVYKRQRAFHEFEVSVFSIAMGLRGRYNENGGVCHEIISGSPWTNRYE